MSRTFLFSGIAVLMLAACAAQPTTGAFGLAELISSLEADGITVTEAGSVEQEFFSTPGRRLAVGGQEIQVFEYADEAARLAESELIQPDGSPNPTTMVTWIDQPNFWAHGRLIVLYVGQESATIELLRAVLGEPLTEPWPGG